MNLQLIDNASEINNKSNHPQEFITKSISSVTYSHIGINEPETLFTNFSIDLNSFHCILMNNTNNYTLVYELAKKANNGVNYIFNKV